MASHNANYIIQPLSGSQNLAALGYNGVTASTVHQVFCLTDGSITITAMGGGQATFPMTAGQSVDVMVGRYSIGSGTFTGFRAKDNKPGFNSNTAV